MNEMTTTITVWPVKALLGGLEPTGGENIKDSLQAAEKCYVARNPISKAAHEEAIKVMPGGNTRSVLFNRPFPICMRSGRGNQLWDVDGHEYLDFLGEMTAGIYGHSNQIVRETITSTFDNVGVNLGAHSRGEAKLASLLCERFPSVEQLRFCNSGTEANLYALSIARHITRKRKIIAFRGGYHGGVLSFAHGVGANNVDPEDWIIGNFNDEKALEILFRTNQDVAAVIVEGMQGAGGCIPAKISFLEEVQKCAAAYGVIFILDEVMTSRLHPSGLQGKYGIRPDMTTLGKYIGGGFTIGAFGGRKDLLAVYDPRRSSSLPHSGTFNNNTLAMAVGHACLTKIYTSGANRELNTLGESLIEKIRVASAGTKMVITGIGAVMTIHFMDNGAVPSSEADLEQQSVPELKKLFWFWCVERGYWIAERGMVSLLLGTTMAQVDSFLSVLRDFICRYRALLEVAKES